jgi:serine/threonine protein kinase
LPERGRKMNNLSGKVLGNRYILAEKIGDGGMALVYKAKCQLLNRYVAIKILRPEFTTDEEFVKKFKRESLAAASLSHPNIVGIYDVGEEDGIYYIVMEYVNGQTLKEFIKQNGKIDYKETLKIVYQIALALEHAHKNGVVHRDVKPHNILITEDKIVKVTDFGIARASSSTTMTNTGRVMGSVHYLSPEQAKGGFSDHRTDIYSLGVVMYEMLTGRPPFDAESPISVALKHIQDTYIEPSSIDKSIPTAVNDIVVKAMEKNMVKRYQNARELINDITLAQNNPYQHLLHDEKDNESTRVIPVEEIDKALEKDKSAKNKVKKKKSKVPVLVGIVLTLAVISLMVFGYNKFFVVKDVVVPKVIGLSEDEGRKVLEDNKLIMEVADRQSSNEPEGEIIRVFPEEGTVVKENSVVKVIISTGQKKVEVPNIIKLDIVTAESMLKERGLKIGNIERRYSDSVPKDMIIETDPDPGSEVLEGQEVNIIISNGPELKLVKVPMLIGKSLDDAKKDLKEANLTLGEIKYGSDNRYVNDVIIEQEVPAGIQVKEGTIVNITINRVEEQPQENLENTDENQQQTDQNQNTGTIDERKGELYGKRKDNKGDIKLLLREN